MLGAWVELPDRCVGRGMGGRKSDRWLTFFTFLFQSSFATCTLTVFRASPAETTIPLISLDMIPADDLVTVFAAAAAAGATALADIAGCGPPVMM